MHLYLNLIFESTSFAAQTEIMPTSLSRRYFMQTLHILSFTALSQSQLMVMFLFHTVSTKNMLIWSQESDTYLTTVCRHRWSRQSTMKVDKLLELSASSAAFISWRGRLPLQLMKATVLGESSNLLSFFHRHLCTPAMSTNSSQIGVVLFPCF